MLQKILLRLDLLFGRPKVVGDLAALARLRKRAPQPSKTAFFILDYSVSGQEGKPSTSWLRCNVWATIGRVPTQMQRKQ